MRSLFAKIFLWFWLAVILVAVAAVISSMWLREYTGPPERLRMALRAMDELPALMAVEAWERAGEQGLREQLALWQRRAGRRMFLFDADRKELAGGPVPEEVRRLLQQVEKNGGTEVLFSGSRGFAATPIRGEGGREYVFVSEAPPGGASTGRGFGPPGRPGPGGPPGPGRGPGFSGHGGPPAPPPERRFPPPLMFLSDNPWELGLVLAVAIVTGGAVCYWLARYLTGPLEKLRTATRRLADGDLSARVGGSMGGRKDEISQLGHDFDRMAERLDTLMAAERRLLRDVSHELRSPLARLSIALGIARQNADPGSERALDRIQYESERLNELIGQLLTLARLEGGIQAATRSQIDLRELLERIVKDADFEAQRRGGHVRLLSDESVIVTGDAELLRRAFENVIRNAVNYTAEGTDVEVGLQAGDGTARVTVRDRGPGVPDESLGELFRPFYRVGDDRDRRTGGTGLGLAIAERAVRAHGGTIQATNAVDGGLVITAELSHASRGLPC